MAPTDAEILSALGRACQQERGGWAAALPVAERLGTNPGAAGTMLNRLARAGYVEKWHPRSGYKAIANLYRLSYKASRPGGLARV